MRLFLIAVGMAVSTGAFAQTFYGPTPYLQHSDSPWFGMAGLQLEDAEDGSFDIVGASCDYLALSSNFVEGLIDSVDIDDGILNGTGQQGPAGVGDAFWGVNSMSIFFGINNVALPTHAGFVWTDGDNPIAFEAFDANGVSLGTLNGQHADNNYLGATDEDRFYGVSYAGGISRITITNLNGIEIDHIQVAGAAVPEPATMIGLGIALGYLAKRRRPART
ncbi:MAG: PEP-CTERM sorting domain-containing protein [Fimbriimonadaceae bacterium]|nr:PEP-CTERM sorting domain-containing protein [Fimbriimonadaceae bacterium]